MVAELELAVGRGERVRLERVRAVGVALDHLGERVALELGAQVHARRAVQVVEPVAVLQLLHLVLEDVVERGAEQAAEQVGDLGEAADPEVDVVEAGGGHAVGVVGPGAGAEHEVAPRRAGIVGGVGRDPRTAGVDDRPGRGPLAGEGRRAGDRRVRAVGRHEVDQRLRVLEVLAEVRPARVRRQLPVVGLGEDLAAHVVERRDAGLAGPRHVERRQVEREAEQVVAQGLGDELVELVADLVRGAHDDRAGGLLRRERAGRAAVEVLGRVEERGQQREGVVATAVAAFGARRRRRRASSGRSGRPRGRTRPRSPG